jgi:ATP-dependent Clp protease ATP-binding subunit ClpA
MAYVFERLTEDAIKALTLAQQEAELRRHLAIATEHVLLGILFVGQGSGYEALVELGISPKSVANMIEAVVGRGTMISMQPIVPTSRVKMALDIALDEARRMNRDTVDSGHLLMGLVIEGEGVAAHALEDLGADAERVVATVERRMGVPPSGRGKDSRPTQELPRLHQHSGNPEPQGDTAVAMFGRLLQTPEIAKLLSTRGVNDVDGLAHELSTPPHAVARLRLELHYLATEIEVAVAQSRLDDADSLQQRSSDIRQRLNRAEIDWIRGLIG